MRIRNLSILLGIGLIILLIYLSDYKKIYRILSQAGIVLVLLAFLTLLPTYILRSLRWRTLINKPVDFFVLNMILFAGNFVNRILPLKLGGMMKSISVAKYGRFGVGEGFASVFMDNVVEISFVLFSCLAIVLSFPQFKDIFRVIAVVSLFFVLVILSILAFFYFKKMVDVFLMRSKKLKWIYSKYEGKIRNDFKVYFNVLSCKKVAIAYMLSVLIWGATMIPIYLLILSLDQEISIPFLYLVTSLPVILGIASSIPGGYGIQEISVTGILILAGIPLAAATSIAILIRTVGLLCASILGVYALYKLDIKTEDLLKEWKVE